MTSACPARAECDDRSCKENFRGLVLEHTVLQKLDSEDFTVMAPLAPTDPRASAYSPPSTAPRVFSCVFCFIFFCVWGRPLLALALACLDPTPTHA